MRVHAKRLQGKTEFTETMKCLYTEKRGPQDRIERKGIQLKQTKWGEFVGARNKRLHCKTECL